jgi:hypothetical protein
VEHQNQQNALMAVYEQLLRENRADVTEFTVKDVITLHTRLGWEGAPRLEFDLPATDRAYIVKPGTRPSRSKAARAARTPVADSPQA